MSSKVCAFDLKSNSECLPVCLQGAAALNGGIVRGRRERNEWEDEGGGADIVNTVLCYPGNHSVEADTTVLFLDRLGKPVVD